MAGQSSAMIGWSLTDVSVLGSQVFGQALMDSCGVNGVLKFQFFFLNLSRKVLAGVGVRTSKYPYMDICALEAKQAGQ